MEFIHLGPAYSDIKTDGYQTAKKIDTRERTGIDGTQKWADREDRTKKP